MIPPDTDFEDLPGGIRDHVEFNFFMQGDVRNFDFLVEDGDTAIAIDDTGLA